MGLILLGPHRNPDRNAAGLYLLLSEVDVR